METGYIPSAHMLVNFPDANTSNVGSKQESSRVTDGEAVCSGGWGQVTQVEFGFLFPPVSEQELAGDHKGRKTPI